MKQEYYYRIAFHLFYALACRPDEATTRLICSTILSEQL